MSRTVVDKDKDLVTLLSESCIPVIHSSKNYTTILGILTGPVHYRPCVHANTFETPYFLAFANHEQFHLVLPSHVSAAQDCNTIHRLL